jgi:hypothetical protein
VNTPIAPDERTLTEQHMRDDETAELGSTLSDTALSTPKNTAISRGASKRKESALGRSVRRRMGVANFSYSS